MKKTMDTAVAAGGVGALCWHSYSYSDIRLRVEWSNAASRRTVIG